MAQPSLLGQLWMGSGLPISCNEVGVRLYARRAYQVTCAAVSLRWAGGPTAKLRTTNHTLCLLLACAASYHRLCCRCCARTYRPRRGPSDRRARGAGATWRPPCRARARAVRSGCRVAGVSHAELAPRSLRAWACHIGQAPTTLHHAKARTLCHGATLRVVWHRRSRSPPPASAVTVLIAELCRHKFHSF